MKKFVLPLIVSVVAYAQFLDDKFVALPAFNPKSKMSEEVQLFVEKNKYSEQKVAKKSLKTDVLGRKTLDSTVYVSDVFSDERMKVNVSFLCGQNSSFVKLFGRYEPGMSENEKKYWLNNEEISEKLYFEKVHAAHQKEQRNIPACKKAYTDFLTAREIENLKNGPETVYISKHKEPRPASNDTIVGGIVFYRDSVIRIQSEIQTFAFPNGYKGNGIGIYFTETGCPNLNYVNQSLYQQGSVCYRGVRPHPTGVARVLQTTAPEAMIYGFDEVNAPNNPLGYSVPIYIGSHSWSISDGSDYEIPDKEMDEYVWNYGLIEFVCAGNKNETNETNYVTSPGKSVNAITVGAVLPDNYYYANYTRWKNSVVGNQKPEVPNFSHFYFQGDTPFSVVVDNHTYTYNGTFYGTSASTPYTAAMAADVLSQHSFFKLHPELFKAVMLTGSTIQVANANSFDLDNYLKIKKIPQYSKMGWGTRSAYWNGSNSDYFETDSSITFGETGIIAGKNYRIAISWLSNGSYVLYNNLLPQDIDLFVYQYGTLIASSTSSNNPFELVDFVAPMSGGITVSIKRVRNSGSDGIKLGYNFLQVD